MSSFSEYTGITLIFSFWGNNSRSIRKQGPEDTLGSLKGTLTSYRKTAHTTVNDQDSMRWSPEPQTTHPSLHLWFQPSNSENLHFLLLRTGWTSQPPDFEPVGHAQTPFTQKFGMACVVSGKTTTAVMLHHGRSPPGSPLVQGRWEPCRVNLAPT